MPINYKVTVALEGKRPMVGEATTMREAARVAEKLCVGILNPCARTFYGNAAVYDYARNAFNHERSNRIEITLLSIGEMTGEKVVGKIILERDHRRMNCGSTEYVADVKIGGYSGQFTATDRDVLVDKLSELFPALDDKKCNIYYDGEESGYYRDFMSTARSVWRQSHKDATEIKMKFFNGDSVAFTRRLLKEDA